MLHARLFRWLLALVVGVVVGPGAAQSVATAPVAPTLEKIRSAGVVRLGYRADAMPFAYLDANQRPIGYGIDICNDIVAGLRRELKLPALRIEYVPVTAANRIEVINTGKADLECGLTVNNPERRKTAGFSLPYYFAGPRILVRTGSGINDFPDLARKRIVSVKGANAVPILQNRIERGSLPGAQLTLVDSNQQAMAALEAGSADAFVTTDNLLYAFRSTAQDPERYQVVGQFLIVEAVAILLRKNDEEFKRAVDRILAGLMIDGTVGRYYNRWFLQPVPPQNRPVGIPMSALLRDQLRWPVDRTGDELLTLTPAR